MQTLSQTPRITDTGADTPCSNCGAPRLFPTTGLRGAELEKWQRGEDAQQENWLECRVCYGLTEEEWAERARLAAKRREQEEAWAEGRKMTQRT